MKTTKILAAALAILALCFNCKKIWTLERMDPGCPEVIRLNPTGAQFDSIVTITGRNFLKGHPELHRIIIHGELLPTGTVIEVTNDSTLRFRVPRGTPCGNVQVQLVDEILCTGEPPTGPYFTYKYTVTNAVLFAGEPHVDTCSSCFRTPRGLAVDPATGDLYVADRDHHVIRHLFNTSSGLKDTIIAGRRDFPDSTNDSNGLFAGFFAPSDLAIDNFGNFYVADELNHQIRKISNGARRGVSKISGSESGNVDNTTMNQARYRRPIGIATDGTDKLFVVEFTGHRLRQIDQKNNFVSTLFGTGTASDSTLRFATGAEYNTARTNEYSVFVADKDNHIVRAVAGQSIHDTVPADMIFDKPFALAADDKGNLFVVDQAQLKIHIVYSDGSYQWLAGQGRAYTFEKPSGIAVDWQRKCVYVSDESAQTVVKITLE